MWQQKAAEFGLFAVKVIVVQQGARFSYRGARWLVGKTRRLLGGLFAKEAAKGEVEKEPISQPA